MQQNEINNMMSDLKKGNVNSEKVASAVEKLNAEQKKTLNDLLNDPELIKKLMSSPKAQSLMEKLK